MVDFFWKLNYLPTPAFYLGKPKLLKFNRNLLAGNLDD